MAHLAALLELQRNQLAGGAGTVTDHLVPRRQRRDVLRLPVRLHVGRRRHRDLAQQRQAPRGQIAVGQGAHADGRIHTLAQQVDIAVALADLQFDVRVTLQEIRQVRKQQVTAQRTVHFNAQRSARWHVTERSFGIVHVRDQAQTAAVEGLAFQRRHHHARGPVQQAHAQALLQCLDRVGHRGPRQPQVFGGTAEAAALDDPHERTQGGESVHCSGSRMMFPDYP
ncbi:hypothetical protein D3C71_1450130 [compost metagenome]